MQIATNITLRKILQVLLIGEEFDLYYFHNRYAMDLGELAEAISFLVHNGLIVRREEFIRITDKGRKDLLCNKQKYFATKDESWLKIPSDFTFNQLRKKIIIEH